MNTTESFATITSTKLTVLNATAQTFVPPISSMLKATAPSFVPPAIVTPASTMPSTLEGFMANGEDVMAYESSPPVHRSNVWHGRYELAKWDQGQVCTSQPEQAQPEPPEAGARHCETSAYKPRKGIRNKAIKKTDQGLEIVDPIPSSHEGLLDSVSGVQMHWEQQSKQKTQDKVMEKMDSGVKVADNCVMHPQDPSQNCDVGSSASSIKAPNLEPPAASFAMANVLKSLGTSERMSADVSSPCIAGPPGLGRRRAYRSPAKRNRDNARLNVHNRHQEQPANEAEKDSSEDGFAHGDGAIEQSMNGTGEVSGSDQAPDEPSPLSISDMLKWRSLVSAEGLPQNIVICSTRYVKSGDLAFKSWQDEAALEQQKWGKKQGAKENQSKNHQLVLKESENSWSAQRKQVAKNMNSEAKSDEEIVRAMKSILNKLTIKKYDTLYQQLLHCGMSTGEHVKILIDEVLEKAETQHPFIQMYCQLCVDLNKWFAERNSTDSANTREHSFRSILLNQCQNKFEENLLPQDLSAVQEHEAEEAMTKHKHAVLGNIKFIGALLEFEMLKGTLVIGIAEKLCSDVSTLESLAVFLTAVGPTFDQPSFKHYLHLQTIFVQVEEKSKDISIAARIRFLLKNVLDLRKSRWSSAK